MDNEQVHILLEKYRSGTLSREEKAILDNWYLTKASGMGPVLSDDELQQNLQQVREAVMGQTKPRARRTYIWSAVAAALVALVAVVWYLNRSQETTPPRSQLQANQIDVQPGGNKAELILADGRAIPLRPDQQGIEVQTAQITYMDGTVIVQGNWQGNHRITIPKGGQYRVLLPDGTKVWLNAESSLSYPARFDNGIREVELEGEAYFDVATANSARGNRIPFIVKTADQEITVLGTAFNVSAYPDEVLTRTTLVHGKVRVLSPRRGSGVLLDPGQEALLSPEGIETRKADIASATAWKDGKFKFNEAELKDVMGQLSRWYDIEVDYRGEIPKRYFYAVMSRDQTLNEVLGILRESGVNFEIQTVEEEKRLIVYPPK